MTTCRFGLAWAVSPVLTTTNKLNMQAAYMTTAGRAQALHGISLGNSAAGIELALFLELIFRAAASGKLQLRKCQNPAGQDLIGPIHFHFRGRFGMGWSFHTMSLTKKVEVSLERCQTFHLCQQAHWGSAAAVNDLRTCSAYLATASKA